MLVSTLFVHTVSSLKVHLEFGLNYFYHHFSLNYVGSQRMDEIEMSLKNVMLKHTDSMHSNYFYEVDI